MTNLLIRRPTSLLSSMLGEREAFPSTRGLMAWDPFQDMLRWDPFQNASLPSTQALFPPLEVKETPTTFELKADVPGIKEEDLDISVSGNRLTLSGKREAEHREDTDTFHAYERSYGSFNRTFNLPDEADTTKIKADLKEGVLMVTVPKFPEARSKKIEIRG